MTDYTWPAAVIPSASEWRLISNTGAFVSPLTGATRTIARGGDRWACTLTVNNTRAGDRAAMRAYLAKMRGQVHRIVVGDHSYIRRGTQAANFAVNGASQTGSSLIVDGGTAAATLLVGDWLTVEGHLYMATADVTFNGSGQATLSIVPPLHSSPANDAVVNVLTPTGRFMLAGESVGWSNVPGRLTSFVVELVEDIA